MTAKIIDGKEIAKKIREELKAQVIELKEKYGIVPGLATVLVGDDPASHSYVGGKIKTCQALGINSDHHGLPAETDEKELLELIDKLNDDNSIHGILVQLPLPDHIDENKVIETINPDKDVDGFHPVSVGRLMIGEAGFIPCTPHGIQELLIRSGVEIEGADVVIVGRSNIVGKPIANILLQKQKGANATVTVCHSRTRDIAAHTRRADILISAIGKPKFITADMVKKGVVVIDVGTNEVGRTAEGKRILVGDVDFEAIKDKATAITPVPGGVGPMTITMLMANTIKGGQANRRNQLNTEQDMEYEFLEKDAPGREKVRVLGSTYEKGKPEGASGGRWRLKLRDRQEKLKYLETGERYWYGKDWFGSEKRKNPA